MTTTHFDSEQVTIHHGDCIDVMRQMPSNSVDAVVCDPPYGLEFMGKEWDNFAPQNTTASVQRGDAGGFGDEPGKPWNKARSGTAGVRSSFRCHTCHGWSGNFSDARAARQRKCECEAPDLDYRGAPNAMLAFQAWTTDWAAEALRVLKPGGHLLAFGGTRTFHRLTAGIEDAGFEIRDSIAWLYGSGFPKSLDVSKAIDKAAGAEREVVGSKLGQPGYHLNGKGHAGPAYSAALQQVTVEQRLAAAAITAPASDEAARWAGWGTALKPAFEPIVVARKPLTGTVAANVLAYGTGALNIDASRIGTTVETWPSSRARAVDARNVHFDYTGTGSKTVPTGAVPPGRWPANVVLDASQAAALDQQSGTLTSGKMQPTRTTAGRNIYGQDAAGGFTTMETYGDTGGASRFFYTAKASTDERPSVDGIAHPTVKPVDLMRWLVKLVTPKGGTVLEPFAGSGTTVEAAVLEGFRCIAIEREADYLPLIMQRVSKPHAVGLDFGDWEDVS